MISIVVTGKNDNYGGHFDQRLELTLKYNVKKFKEAGIDAEIVFVEWNPISGTPLLSEKVATMFDNVKCYVVEKEEHDIIAGPNTYMTFLEFFAKNVGIRRASGDYVVCTNADVFYGNEVFDKIANTELDKNIIYRTRRDDIRFHKLESLTEEGFKNAKFRTNPLNGKPYVDASGDFTMASKELFEKLNGYDENMRFVKIHKDSRILFSALHNSEIDYVNLGVMYHIDHEGSAVGTTGKLTDYRPTNGPYHWKYVLDLPYKNRHFWGMSREIVDEIKLKNNIYKLKFKESFNPEEYNFQDEKYHFDKNNTTDVREYVETFKRFQNNYLFPKQREG